jgi:multicomponent Na+:H+ antiporter subunit D
MIGVPPAVGFISKWYLINGVIERWELSAEHFDEIFVLVVILLSTLLNACYFLPIIYRAFFKPLSEEDQKHPHGESPMAIVYALSFTAALTLLFFFWHKPAADLAELVRRAVA